MIEAVDRLELPPHHAFVACGMTTRISESLQTTRVALRRTAMLRGMALVVAVVVGSITAIGCLDWAIHVDDPNTRVALAIAIGIAGTAALTWWVVLPATTRLSDLQIAKRIEFACPELAGRLSNSVEFLNEASDGSLQLQQHTINRVVEDLGGLRPDQLVDRNPLRIAGTVAAVLISMGAFLFAASPVTASTAVSRLILPLRSNPWPRATDLRMIDETGQTLPRETALTVVLGESFEVLAENTRGQLPDDCVVEHRLGTRGQSQFEPLQPTTLEAQVSGEAGRAIITPTRGPIYLRVVGGDHWSPWYRLNVVSPPTLSDLQFELVLPEYLQREPEILSLESSTMDAVIGSRLRITGAATKPIQSASTVFDDQIVPAEISQQRGLRCEIELNREGTHALWIELTDTNGIKNPRPARYELRVVPDAPPDVVISQPAENLHVTADAVFPIHAVARDDYAVQSLRLEVTDDRGTTSIVATAIDDGTNDAGTVEVDLAFDLTQQQAQPGQQFVLRGVAADAVDVHSKSREVTSDVRTVLVVTAEAKAAELAQQQATLLDELRRTNDAQLKALNDIGDLKIQQHETGLLRRVDLDLLKATELDQQRIRSSLFDGETGLADRFRALATAYDQNQLGLVDTRSNLDDILGELNHIHDRVTTALEVQLSIVRKDVEEAITESGSAEGAVVPNLASHLDNVQQLQSEVVDSLQSVLAGTESWRQRVDLLAALTRIAARLDEIIRDTNRLGSAALAGTTEADRRQIKADASRLAQQQLRLAVEFDLLLNHASAEPAQETTGVSTSGKKLLRLASDSTPNLKMRAAASELTAGRAGAAGQLQQEAARGLADLISLLSQPEDTTGAELEEVRAIGQALQSLLEEQVDLIRQLESGTDFPETAAVQGKLRQRAERHNRQLVREEILSAAAETSAAAKSMRSAEGQLAAEERDAAAKTMAKAAASLDEAIRSVRGHQRQKEDEAAKSGLQNAAVVARNMAAQQKAIALQTRQFEVLLQQSGRRSRRQSREVLKLGEREGTLAGEVGNLRDRLHDVEVASLLLESISGRMRVAEGRLSKRLTDAETVRLQELAAGELMVFAEALQELPPNPSDPPAEPQQVPVDRASPESGRVPIVMQLKLIRALQQSVAGETERLAAGTSSTEERAHVADRQREVARLTSELLGKLESDGGK